LFSLIFGIPVMIMMIFNMVRAAAATCPEDSSDELVTSTAGSSVEKCGSHSLMLLPGLSLTNLLLFLMCTPCQVCCTCTYRDFY